MIGRVYKWRDQLWIVLIRWHGRGPRNVLIERVERYSEWLVKATAEAPALPDGTVRVGAKLYPNKDGPGMWVAMGEKTVRPFRGLRRV